MGGNDSDDFGGLRPRRYALGVDDDDDDFDNGSGFLLKNPQDSETGMSSTMIIMDDEETRIRDGKEIQEENDSIDHHPKDNKSDNANSSSNNNNNNEFRPITKLSAAFSYGASSVAIQLANKITLTSYGWPSVNAVALLQCILVVLSLTILKYYGYVSYPDICMKTLKVIMPLPIIQIFNVGCGLFGTKAVNIPMFTVLRRSSVLMTLLAELYILGQPVSKRVQCSVAILCCGSLFAACNDLTFEILGYAAVTASAVATTAYGITSKMKLSGPNKCTKWEILWYNSAVSIPFFATLILIHPTEIDNMREAMYLFEYPGFVVALLLSVSLGFILNFFILFNTQVNGPLNTTIVGTAKNVLTTYIGMMGLGGDYVYSHSNFIGLNLSMGGALLYSWAKIKEQKIKERQ